MILLINVGLALILLIVLYWNLVRPQLTRGAALPAAAPAAATASAGASASAPAATPRWRAEYFWTILVLVAGAVLAFWSLGKKPAEMGSVGQEYWLTILIVWGMFAVLTALNVEKKTASVLQTVFAGVALSLLVVFPIWNWLSSPSATLQRTTTVECSSSNLCSLALKTDGSTEIVKVPEGKFACFEPSFWDNLERLGWMTSYKGGPEAKYGCTKQQAMAGTCSQSTFDSFRFVPEAGVNIPKYWFVPESTPKC